MAKYCTDCGTKMNGQRCPNCHEELEIIDQYCELGMKLPDPDSAFMEAARYQQKQIDKKLKDENT